MVPPLPDPAQVDAARTGAPEARERLVDAALPAVLGWCRRLGGPGVSAEDAAHDVLVVVLERLPTLRDPQAFPAWLFQVTRRVLAGHRRRSWLRRGVSHLLPDLVDPSPGPAGRHELSERAEAVRAVLEHLPEPQRIVLVLCDVEGRCAPEVSRLLGVPEGTVRSRLRLARARFREIASLPDETGEEPLLVRAVEP